MTWAPAYASTNELGALVRIEDNLDQAQMSLALEAASRAIDLATNRQFGQLATAEDRLYIARWLRDACRWAVEIDDLMTTTGLVVKLDTSDSGTYPDTVATEHRRLRPINAAAKGRPWTNLVVHPNSSVQPSGLEAGVQVTAQWGWSAVPHAIKEATLLQASRLLARRDAPFGVAGSPEAGSEVRLLARLDPDVAVAVAPYRRWWGAV